MMEEMRKREGSGVAVAWPTAWVGRPMLPELGMVMGGSVVGVWEERGKMEERVRVREREFQRVRIRERYLILKKEREEEKEEAVRVGWGFSRLREEGNAGDWRRRRKERKVIFLIVLI